MLSATNAEVPQPRISMLCPGDETVGGALLDEAARCHTVGWLRISSSANVTRTVSPVAARLSSTSAKRAFRGAHVPPAIAASADDGAMAPELPPGSLSSTTLPLAQWNPAPTLVTRKTDVVRPVVRA